MEIHHSHIQMWIAKAQELELLLDEARTAHKDCAKKIKQRDRQIQKLLKLVPTPPVEGEKECEDGTLDTGGSSSDLRSSIRKGNLLTPDQVGELVERASQIIKIVSLQAVTCIDDEYYEWPKEDVAALRTALTAMQGDLETNKILAKDRHERWCEAMATIKRLEEWNSDLHGVVATDQDTIATLTAERDTLHARLIKEFDEYVADKTTLTERVKELEGALQTIVDGIPAVRAEGSRKEGVISKCDKCPHGRYIYEGCEECVSDFARAALKPSGEER